MYKLVTIGLMMLLCAGCAPTNRMSLDQVNPTRSYVADYESMLDAIRMYSTKEGFKIDRFETEYGTIIGHKTFSSGYTVPGVSDNMVQVIVMKLSVKKETPQRTTINAGFSFGSGHTTATKEDESILVEHYSSLFEYMNDKFKQ